MPDDKFRTYVTEVKLEENELVLTVALEGFTPGEAVEVTGEVTKDNGGFATFYDIQNAVAADGIPAGASTGGAAAWGPGPGNGSALEPLTVKASPVDVAKFQTDGAITTVVRVAKVWATMLSETKGAKVRTWKAKDAAMIVVPDEADERAA